MPVRGKKSGAGEGRREAVPASLHGRTSTCIPCILTEILPDKTSLTGICKITSPTRPEMISMPGRLRRLFTFAALSSRLRKVTLPFRSCSSRFSTENVCGSRKAPRTCARA